MQMENVSNENQVGQLEVINEDPYEDHSQNAEDDDLLFGGEDDNY